MSPRYDIKCGECGHVVEIVSLSGKDLPRCERCDGPTNRVWSFNVVRRNQETPPGR